MLINAALAASGIVAAEIIELLAISRMICISYVIVTQHLFRIEQLDLINYDRKCNCFCFLAVLSQLNVITEI